MGFLDRIAGRFDELVAGESESQTRARQDIDLGRGFAERGNLEDAAVAFGRAVDSDPASADAWLGLGETLGRLGRFEPARDAFRRALTLPLGDLQRPHAQAALGELYARAGQTGKAIRELRRAAIVLSDDVHTTAALGRALVTGREAEGSEWLARAARLPGGSASLLVEAARAAADPAVATRLWREATEREPVDALMRAGLARQLAATGDIDGARREAARVATADPEAPAVWGALREVYGAAGDYPAAIEAARQEATRGTPAPFAVWLRLALGAGDRAAVEETLRHGQPSDPGFAEARGLLERTLNDAGVIGLARVAPHAEARLFVMNATAPQPPPAGNIYALLAWAEALATRHPPLLPLAVSMARAQEAFDRPLLVAVMGEFNAGKSSFVNALAGAPVAPVGVTPTTATINVLRFGAKGGGRAIYHDGTARDLEAGAVSQFLGALSDADAELIRQVEIFAPVEALRRVEIVDTPGLNSLREAHEKVARDFLLEADAIVWVFAAGQAAKATEREALAAARAAGKRVLGVLNKVDRATPAEIAEVVRHVESELGNLVEHVVPLSARAALDGRMRGDSAAVDASGLSAVEAALEADFFGQVRELKRATALLVLGRFVSDARAAAAGVVTPVADFVGGSGDRAAAEAVEGLPGGLAASAREALAAVEGRLRSEIAAERVALRARLDAAFRVAASEVREFVRPRAWLFGDHTADPEDEAFLRELLDDGAVAATAKTRAALMAAAAAPTPIHAADATPGTVLPAVGPAQELQGAIDDAIERFRAYARGVIEGAAAVFFRVDLPRIRLDLAAIYKALGRWSPDPEDCLFRPLERAVDTFVTRARANLDERERTSEIAELMRREQLLNPLDALAEALARLSSTPLSSNFASTSASDSTTERPA